MPRPPPGFELEKYPLHHRFNYGCALSLRTLTKGSTMLPILRSSQDPAIVDPVTITPNPHNVAMDIETGSLVQKMSIIDNLQISLHFSMTKVAINTNSVQGLKMWWMPIFFSFPEKLDAADDDTGITVKAILELTKDATNKDVTPTYAVKLPASSSDADYPLSTVNDTEVIGDVNLTTDASMEAVAFDADLFFNHLKLLTNKGALKSVIGQRRHFTLTQERPNKSFFIKKFLPKAVRRIMDYSFFAILIHVPSSIEPEQYFYSNSIGADAADVGIKMLVNYNEWNDRHSQAMV